MDEVQIRRRILQMLYEERRRQLPGALEYSELARHLALTSQEVRFNVSYLAEKELVESSKSTVGQRIFFFVQITAKGIDLVEDPNEFNNRFPPQVVVQNVLGDKLDIVIGDHASNVSVGKDIVHVVQFGASNQSLTAICAKFLEETRAKLALTPEQMESITTQVHNLTNILAQEEPDLGKVQQIKRFLAEQEGRPAVRTSVLFSHEAVAGPIRQAVARLIGHPEGDREDV